MHPSLGLSNTFFIFFLGTNPSVTVVFLPHCQAALFHVKHRWAESRMCYQVCFRYASSVRQRYHQRSPHHRPGM